MELSRVIQCIAILFIGSVAATMECRECIALEDLITHGYGISISLHGVTSATCFHNRTARSSGSLTPLPALTELLGRWRTESAGRGLSNPWPRGFIPGFPKEKQSWMQLLWARVFRPVKEEEDVAISRDAQLLCDIFLTLRDQNAVPPMKNIGISVPVWTTDVQAQDIFAAARCAGLTIRDLVHDAAATAASQDIDLCRVPSEYLPCDPQHVMTLDLSEKTLIASSHSIQQTWYLWQPRRYEVSDRLGQLINDVSASDTGANNDVVKEAVDWINNFVEDQPVHKLYLIGPLARNSVLMEVVGRSRVGTQLQHLDSFGHTGVVAAGTARLVKLEMEEQISDCIEPPWCEEIRKEADRLVGQPHVEEDREL